MNKKICFITGANSGIGKAAAIQLAANGFHTLVGSRSEERGTKAITEIKQQSNSNDVELVTIDLSSQMSIVEAVSNINSKFDKIDVLIHNAADFDLSRKQRIKSVDGIETIWATNHIGPVLLTNNLLDKLKNSEQGRIITVSSQGLMIHPYLKVDIMDPEFTKRKFSVAKAYYQSKLAQVMYTYWLSEKLEDTRITVNCIRVTNVKIDIDRYPNLPRLFKYLYSIKSKFSISPDQMAKTYLYLATSKELNNITGEYFDEKNRIVSSSKYSLNDENIKNVMNLTIKYTK